MAYYQYGTYFGQNPTVQKPPPYKSPYVSDPTYGQAVAQAGGQFMPNPGTPAASPPATGGGDPFGGGGGGGGGRPPIDFSHLDYSNDPILARVRALSEEAISHAQADATANRTRLVIGLGDPELARSLGLGDKVSKQAEENTFGTFQELGRQLGRRNIFEIDRPLSDTKNLFYSTERARQRALSGEQFLRDKAQATNQAQSQLATIAQQVAQVRMEEQARRIQAEQDAYQRAVQQAIYAAGG